MTPTQFDALNSAIANSIAASRAALAKIDLLLSRLTASEPIELFNAAQDAPESVEASEVPNQSNQS